MIKKLRNQPSAPKWEQAPKLEQEEEREKKEDYGQLHPHNIFTMGTPQ
jgi:hypothetical protein